MSKDPAREPVEGDLVAPLDEAEARALTDEIRAAIKGVKAATGRLAAAVRRAHQARVWVTLGYPSWKAYAKAEFGIGRSHAYRLVDQAVTAEQLAAALVELGLTSPAGDDALLLGDLSGRAWREIQNRAHDVAALVADRAAESGGTPDVEQLRALIVRAVDEVRAEESRPATPEEAVPTVDDPDAFAHWEGTIALRHAPAHLTETEASAALHVAGYDTETRLTHAMAVRAFALDGNRDQLQAFRAALDVPEQGGHGYSRQHVVAGRALVEQLQMACWRQGMLYLEIAPSRLPDRAAARVLAAAFGEDPQSITTAERVEVRRYAITGDFQAYEEWENRALARA
ncbi:hypothetical protein [Streptomyces sp. NBRC 110465]|uniref:hypothetical protein n=1 Tax=Streptomyces sp. NBRC 110465 TaxID=1897621 RepID=UPI000933CBD7|nr:hypothetical protein [Streptomyces sp. NBRC 110465]